MNKIQFVSIIASSVAILLSTNFSAFAENTTLSTDEKNYYMVASDGDLYCVPYIKEDIQDDDYYDVATNELVSKKIMDDVVSVSWNYVLQEDHTLWRWNTETDSAEFISSDVLEMSGSSTHVLFIKDDNTLWGVGSNEKGELAQGTPEYSLDEQEELKNQKQWTKLLLAKCNPAQYDEPVLIENDVVSAVAGTNCSYILKENGDLYRFGWIRYTYKGEVTGRMLNVPEKFMENIKEVFGEGIAGFAVKNDGKDIAWYWGSAEIDLAGIIIIPDPVEYADNVKNISVHPGTNYVVKNDGSLWLYESNPSLNDNSGDISFASEKNYGKRKLYIRINILRRNAVRQTACVKKYRWSICV